MKGRVLQAMPAKTMPSSMEFMWSVSAAVVSNTPIIQFSITPLERIITGIVGISAYV